jgi:hypothetical protein
MTAGMATAPLDSGDCHRRTGEKFAISLGLARGAGLKRVSARRLGAEVYTLPTLSTII